MVGLALAAEGIRTLYVSRSEQSGAALEWESQPESKTYRPGDLLGKMYIPRLGAEWFFREGSGEQILARGPGRLEGTAAPGSPGNCVIAGHRDTHFRVLKDIRDGDEVVIESGLHTSRYRVTGTRVVYPSNTTFLRQEAGAKLTLVTCFPFYYVGPAPKRFIVRAELISRQPAGALSGGQTARAEN